MHDITKSFSGVKALDAVTLKVEKGDIHALMGANGAGKSTLMKILSGILKPDANSGYIILDGETVRFKNPTDAQEKGISIVFQELTVIRHLNVLENIFLNREIVRKGFYDWAAMRKKARLVMDDLGVHYDINTRVGDLSIAQQQMVEIIKAVSTDVKVLILDEPTSSLAEKETQLLFEMIHKLHDRGVTIVYISHRMEEIYQLCNRISVLRDGKFLFTKSSEELSMADLASSMIGRNICEEFPKRKKTSSEEIVLSVEDLSSERRFRNIKFSLHKGEILGLAGLVGAGRTEVGRALFGEYPVKSGKIFFEGKQVRIRSSRQALNLGIAYATEDRKHDGVLFGRSIQENACLASLNSYWNKFRLIDRRKEAAAVSEQIRNLAIKATGPAQEIQYLSGGNQQKTCLAKWLLVKPKVLILDEPTRGIDVGAKAEFYQIICDLADQGTSILMISSEESELVGLCEKIIVLKEGEITSEFKPYDGCMDELSSYMFGLEYDRKGKSQS